MIQGYVENATPEQRLSGQVRCTIMRKHDRAGDMRYVAWTRTWEGPARYEFCAAQADLSDRLRAGLVT